MPYLSRTITFGIVLLLAITSYIIAYGAGIPAGTGSNTSSFSNPASSTNKQKNILSNQDNKASATDSAEQKEPNPILYENYQQCYASHITDFIGRPSEEVDARKVTIKKYCRAISVVKYQKRFSDCFNGNMGSGNRLDDIINDCVSCNNKPLK